LPLSAQQGFVDGKSGASLALATYETTTAMTSGINVTGDLGRG
jgi:hypothetical protein